MRKKYSPAFTLVELIVTITILAILGTIGFISFRGYSKDARNSNRITDMKIIVKSMSLYQQREALYPEPDNPSAITYSGWLAWTQGSFGVKTLGKIGRISTIPVDPLTGSAYAYSVVGNGQKYQIGGALEGWLFSYGDIIVPRSYALSNSELSGYTMWDFISQEIVVSQAGVCSVVASPSIILSDIPASHILLEGSLYNYSYTDSPHIPTTYSGAVEENASGNSFQITQVFSGCAIENMAELDLYIARLSTAYQALASIKKYENLVFNSNTKAYKVEAAINLQSLGINVSPALMEELNAPPPEQLFGDMFSGSDGTLLVGGHSPDTGSGSWSMISGGTTSSYILAGNKVSKSGSSSSFIYPTPLPSPLLTNYRVGFTIEDFAGGFIESYLRYSDVNNYYKVRLLPTGYQVMRRHLWVDSIFQDISDPITSGSSVVFSIIGDTLTLNLNGIEKENILAGELSSIWIAPLLLQNDTASIDNYSFTYQ